MRTNLPEPLLLIAGPYRFNKISEALPTERIRVCLVNLVAGGKYSGKTQPAAGIQVLAGYLRATTQAEVHIVDMQTHLHGGANEAERYQLATQRVIEEVRSCSADINGLSMKWGTLKPAEDILQALRREPGQHDPLFVIGNTLATFCSKELLLRSAFQDTVAVLGEGEEALRTIVERASQNQPSLADPRLYVGIPNVKTESVDDRAIIRARVNLAEYPLLTEANAPEMFKDIPWVQFEGSRGCQWSHCTFCSIKTLYGSPEWKPFPTPLILDRLERYIRSSRFREMGNAFWLADSDAIGMAGKMTEADFGARVARIEELAAGIKGLRAHYSAYLEGALYFGRFSLRPDALYREGEAARNIIRERTLEKLHEAGLREVYLGFESGNSGSLKLFAKGVTVEENRQAAALPKKLGIAVGPGLIFFEPEEGIAGLRDNAIFIEGAEMGHMDVYGSLRAQIGSPIVKRLRAKGLLGEFDLDQASFKILWDKSDPAVRGVQQIFERVQSATRKLVDHLDYQGNTDWVKVFKQLDGDFIFWYIRKDEPQTETVWSEPDNLTKVELFPGMTEAAASSAPATTPPVQCYQDINLAGRGTGEKLILAVLVHKFRGIKRLLENVEGGHIPDPNNRLKNELIPEAEGSIREWLAELV